MTEEEKKAIEDLKRLKTGIEFLNKITTEKDEVDIVAIETVLNLIEKQSKEIEELKDKNKWIPIREYSRDKYDWVLVKYYDGDYECVPEVAELRNDNKWHTTERIIPFEVKYFYDMQLLKEEQI